MFFSSTSLIIHLHGLQQVGGVRRKGVSSYVCVCVCHQWTFDKISCLSRFCDTLTHTVCFVDSENRWPQDGGGWCYYSKHFTETETSQKLLKRRAKRKTSEFFFFFFNILDCCDSVKPGGIRCQPSTLLKMFSFFPSLVILLTLRWSASQISANESRINVTFQPVNCFPLTPSFISSFPRNCLPRAVLMKDTDVDLL